MRLNEAVPGGIRDGRWPEFQIGLDQTTQQAALMNDGTLIIARSKDSIVISRPRRRGTTLIGQIMRHLMAQSDVEKPERKPRKQRQLIPLRSVAFAGFARRYWGRGLTWGKNQRHGNLRGRMSETPRTFGVR